MMIIRAYRPDDEQGWLRCRVLSFLDTSYYRDVKQAKEHYAHPAIELVAEKDGCIVGLLDIELDSDDLTWVDQRGAIMWHLAVLPEYRRNGVAAALWAQARTILQMQGIRHYEVWTQEDIPANHFYRAVGFELCREQCWLRCEASADICGKMLLTCVAGDVYGAECFIFDAPLERREELAGICSKMTEVRLYRSQL